MPRIRCYESTHHTGRRSTPNPLVEAIAVTLRKPTSQPGPSLNSPAAFQRLG